MWTSKQSKTSKPTGGNACIGVVTAAGQHSGVHLGTERRWLPVLAPGGYRWRPRAGEQVLVLKTGAEDETACVLARQEQDNGQLRPGEVELYAPGCALKLTQTGQVELTGKVSINGTALEDLVRSLVSAALSGQEG